jgi:dehydrogenase/reductase SDR family protein 7B
MSSFKDKVVWITGASSGIGEALTHAFNEAGAKVILSSRKEEGLQKVKDSCSGDKSNLTILPLDLGELDSLEVKANEVLSKFGHVDIIINNGGISQRDFAINTSLEVDQKLMRINFFGAVALTKALLPSMIKRKKGHIVVISSLTGKFGTPKRSTYAASKHALHGFYDSLRAEIWKDGVDVSIVCPGFIKTNVSINSLTGDGSTQGTMDEKTGAGMEPKDFAVKMLRALEKKKEEVYIGGNEKMGVYLKRFVPTVFSKIIKKAKVT